MYSGSSDGKGRDSSGPRKIPPVSSMLWVRKFRRYIGSGTGLGSESLMELETKRILLDMFKEKQQKSSEVGTIPSFYKKKPEEGSVSQRVQRLAKYRFLKKQTDLLLNADDFEAMWLCLRENCVIDDATGAEKPLAVLCNTPNIVHGGFLRVLQGKKLDPGDVYPLNFQLPLALTAYSSSIGITAY
ncbi:putative serine/threonine-protein phosphatase 2A regulatory subunit B'' subunit TON2 [Abeliophyllum distichum]|uniref:Serine/threonine-protein phosphatase 2A regulatory subunit B'' subunit TON2 n=1 Tax=Abeliophyllum distichum TaxID=126358 RepID=A0ABD1Q591_9LAMI